MKGTGIGDHVKKEGQPRKQTKGLSCEMWKTVDN